MKSRKRFRVGQRVRSVYDRQRAFVIDKSIVPARLYHEKGSDRWWTKNELEAITATARRVKPLNSRQLRGVATTRFLALKSVAMEDRRPTRQPKAPTERKCQNCPVRFKPKRPWQKFHSEACRWANWKEAESARQDAALARHGRS